REPKPVPLPAEILRQIGEVSFAARCHGSMFWFFGSAVFWFLFVGSGTRRRRCRSGLPRRNFRPRCPLLHLHLLVLVGPHVGFIHGRVVSRVSRPIGRK